METSASEQPLVSAAVASDVMSRKVVAVRPGTTLGQAVDLMVRHRISGLPVVNDIGQVVGMLSEGDLLRRAEVGTEGTGPGWLARLLRPGTLAADYVETHGRRVGEIMTTEVVSVGEEAPLWQIAALMQKNRIKRIPVLRVGQLVGIVSRADLIAQLGRALPQSDAAVADDVVQRTILAAIEQAPWGSNAAVSVSVQGGVVTLEGCLFDMNMREAVQVLAENAPGVKSVENNVICIEPMSGMIMFDPAENADTAQHAA